MTSAYVPKPCCLTGWVHDGKPAGRVEKVHGLDCYVTEPSDPSAPKAIIVYIPDVFGWSMPNNRLLADNYARRTGARVYLPDFMAGNAFPPHAMELLHTLLTPSPGWISMFYDKTFVFFQTVALALPRMFGLGDSYCRPRIISFLTALRGNEARGLKIGTAGFCWGGHHTIDLCSGLKTADGELLIDAGFSAHPSNAKVPEDYEKVQLPLSISIGDVDFMLPVDKCREAQRTLEAKTDASKYEFNILPGAKHGFAARHSKDDELELRLAQDAEDQAVAFWARWLGTNPLEK